MLLAVLVYWEVIWQKILFQINQSEESSKITVNAHTTSSSQLHQRSITTASTLVEVFYIQKAEGWSIILSESFNFNIGEL